jgi:hypothetical protein
MTQRIKYWSVIPNNNVKYIVPMTPEASIQQMAQMQQRPQYLSSFYRDGEPDGGTDGGTGADVGEVPGGGGGADAGGGADGSKPVGGGGSEPVAPIPPTPLVKSDFMSGQGIMFLMIAIVIIIFLVMRTTREEYREYYRH